jgi:hypothetical protein
VPINLLHHLAFFHSIVRIPFPLSLFICHPLLQISALGLLVNHIKKWFRAEPPSPLRANGLMRKLGIFRVNLNSLTSTPSRSSVGQKLCVAALLEADEPEDGGLDGLSNRKKTVVLEQCSLVVAERLGNLFAFDLG